MRLSFTRLAQNIVFFTIKTGIFTLKEVFYLDMI